jgi:O-antigen/teichoic acid export membrane protein
MMGDSQTITQKATTSIKWTVLMEVVNRTASPIIFVILARLLTPTDFGVMATAMIIISFAQVFWDAGLSRALIQSPENVEAAADVIFWTNLFLAALIYILLFFASPQLAAFFSNPAAEPVLRVLGFQIIIASLTSVQQALLVRALDFRRLFWIKLLTSFVPGIISIPLALYGYGVWALVSSSLAGQVLYSVMLWTASPWRPHRTFNFTHAKKLFRFGIWAVGESLAAWFFTWGDNLLVGKFLGVHDLGVYRTGWMIVAIIFGLVFNPFASILFPIFSRLQDNFLYLKGTFQEVNRLVMACALPMGAGLLLSGGELADVLFGIKWQGLGFVMSSLGFMLGISWLVGINSELYRAMGRPDVNTKLMFIAILYYLPAYLFAAQFGLRIFVITRVAVALAAIPLHIFFCRKILGVSPFYLWHEGKRIVLAAMLMVFAVTILKSSMIHLIPLLPTYILLTLMLMTGVTVYIGSLWLLDRSFVMQIKVHILRATFG